MRLKSTELLNSSDEGFTNARDDQHFEANKDIAQLMATLTSVKE